MKVEHIISTGANDTEAVEEVLIDLEEAITPEPDDSNKSIIPPGNIQATVDILSHLAESRSEVEGDANVSQNEIQVTYSA